MKKTLIIMTMIMLMLIILTTNFAYAKEAKAYLNLYIINEPPKITGMGIYGFAETGLRCNASFEDEHKDIVTLHYYWYKDDVLVSDNEILNKDLIKKGDSITCKIVPDDRAQLGSPENVTVSVLAEPMDLKLNRITGSIVGGVSSNKEFSFIGFLIFLIIILIIVNVAIIRRSYSPQRVISPH